MPFFSILGTKSGAGMHRSMSKSLVGWGSSTNRRAENTSSNPDGDTDDIIDPNNPNSAIPRLSVCADSHKVDRAKLAQTEVRYFRDYSRMDRTRTGKNFNFYTIKKIKNCQ